MANILIVDDEPLIRSHLKTSLKPYGKSVLAKDGFEGVNAFEEALDNNEEFDIIFLDISMEKKTGLDVLKEVRLIEKMRSVPIEKATKIIMVTGNAEASIVKECITFGCDKFIVKPFFMETIVKTLDSLGFKPLKK